MGAIASGGSQLLDAGLISSLHIPNAAVRTIVAEEQQELARRERLYRENRPPLALANQIVILADDGLATGSTMAGPCRRCDS